MNYNVMKRPMFRMGGKAASQGTGITSGLDEKVNMTDGRANYAEGPDLYKQFLKSALEKQEARDKAIAGMDDLITLRGLGRVGQALSTEESNNPFEIFKNLAMSGSEIALPLLSARKKQELLKSDPKTDLAFAKAFKPTGGFGQKVYELKLENLGKLEKQEDQLRAALKDEKIDQKQFDIEMGKIIIRKKIAVGSSFKTDEDYIDAAREFLQENRGGYTDEQVIKKAQEFKALGSRILQADGGRVNRRMGSDDDGEIPEDPTKPINPFAPKPIKPLGDGKMAFDDTPRFELRSLTDLLSEFEADNRRSPNSIDELKRYFYNKYGPDFLSKIDEAVANESKDVAMETKGQGRGNQVFDMLRARLPQEITDDVVQLISYDKTAFADFASIKNQEDVTSFNDKYGTQLVIDVATV
jgi:hypothetical protein